MILLDTTACIDYLRGHISIQHLIPGSKDLFAISTISIYEVSIGLERTRRLRSQKIYQQQKIAWNKFTALMEILNLTPEAAAIAAETYDYLSQEGKMIEDDDILIVGIMKSNNIGKIITRNRKHFEKIPNISVMGYSV